MERLNNYVLSPAAIAMVSGSSKGTQAKYYDRGYWYKTNNIGYEGTAEYLASRVLSCSNVEDYVIYEKCTINGHPGCRSFNFLKKDESYISLQRLYELYVGGQLSDSVYKMDNIEERIRYVVDFVKEYTKLDIFEYLRKMMSFDAFSYGLKIDYDKIKAILQNESHSRALEVLKMQLDYYEDRFRKSERSAI